MENQYLFLKKDKQLQEERLISSRRLALWAGLIALFDLTMALTSQNEKPLSLTRKKN